MTNLEHPDMADHELLVAINKEEMAGGRHTGTALLASLCDYNTFLPPHGIVYVDTQGRKHLPACFSSCFASYCPSLCVGHSQLFCSAATLKASQHHPPP